MGRLLGFLARVVVVVLVGIGAIVRPRQVRTPGVETAVRSTPEQQALAARQPSPEAAAAAHELATHSPIPQGWSHPKPATTPQPSYWPFVLAIGTTFFAWGLISNLFVFFGGLLMFLVAAVGWIGDLLNEFA